MKNGRCESGSSWEALSKKETAAFTPCNCLVRKPSLINSAAVGTDAADAAGIGAPAARPVSLFERFDRNLPNMRLSEPASFLTLVIGYALLNVP